MKSQAQMELQNEYLKRVILIHARCGVDASDEEIKYIADELYNAFKKQDQKLVHNALRLGSLGYYGTMYKITVNSIGDWIWREIKNRTL